MSEQNDWPLDWMGPFLEKLSETGNVRKSCRHVKKSHARVYKIRKENPEFKQAMDDAINCAVKFVLEPEAWKRAVEGVLQPVFQGGKRVGSVRKYSDTLMAILLKAHDPEKYSERIRQSLTSINIDVTKLTDEQLIRIASGEDPALVIATSSESGARAQDENKGD